MSNAFDFGSGNIALAFDVPFPSNVNPGPGIGIDKTGALWTVSLDYLPLSENTQPTPNVNYIAIWDAPLGIYQKARLDNVVSTATGLDTRTVIGDANYLVQPTDRYIAVAAPLTLNRIITLPPASSVPGGREILIQDEIGTCNSAHYLAIVTTGTDMINGRPSRAMSVPYGGVRLRSNGTNAWSVIALNSMTSVADSNYTCNIDDRIIAYYWLSASRVCTLPSSSAYAAGQRILVCDQNGACSTSITIAVTPQAGDVINGAAAPALINAPFGFVGLITDGTGRWTIIDEVGGGSGSGGTITSAQITDASAIGRLLLTQPTAQLDRATLGSGTTGDQLFISGSPVVARAVLGSGATGDLLFQTATPAAAISTLGLGTMATQNANNVNITGGTITGVSIPGLGGVFPISDIPPGAPQAGQPWWDSAGGNLYVWYPDGTSSQWVPATNPSGFLPSGGGTISGNLTVTGSLTAGPTSVASLNGGPLAGLRNKLMNGSFRVDQRAFASTGGGTLAGGYFTDRWNYSQSQASKFSAATAQGTMGTLGGGGWCSFTSLTATVLAAADNFAFAQVIEGLNCIDLAFGTANAKPVTLSFAFYSSLTGTHSASLVNKGGTRSYVFTWNNPVANTWTPVAITIPGDTAGTWAVDNTQGIGLRFSLGCGSTYLGAAGAWSSANFIGATGAVQPCTVNGATFVIGNVQLEQGSVATPFEFRPIGTELSLCQRYYQRFTDGGFWAAGYVSAPANVVVLNQSVSPMRAAPTGTVIGTWSVTDASQPIFPTAASKTAMSLYAAIPAAGQWTCACPANAGFDLNAEL